jgi:hypothetical protein
MPNTLLEKIEYGEFVLSITRKAPQAIEFFKTLPIIKNFLP